MDVERFWLSVEVGGTDDCWLWRGAIFARGYGSCYGDKHWRALMGTTTAHRIAWQLLVPYVPIVGLELHHNCRNRLCCNPNHLEPVTRKEHRARDSGAATRCIYGHEFNEENTYWRPGRSSGQRDCRVCVRERQRRCKRKRLLEAA